MIATLYLLGCALLPGQTPSRITPPPAALPGPRGDWIVMPRLSRSQELVYRGSCTEEARGGRVQFVRACRLELRIFVLETPPRGAEVALLTILRHRDARADAAPISAGPPPTSVRLERAHVNLQGRLSAAPGVNLLVPLEGPPAVECGAFLEVPGGRLGPGTAWEVTEEGRPMQAWSVAGSEMIGGAACIKLVGVQKTDDWDRPRGDRSAWRRLDTVWLSTRLGIACRVERRIEHREAGRAESTQWSVLRYELDSSLQYPGQLGEDRKQEITQAMAFREALAPMLTRPAKYGPQLTALLTRINQHLDNQPPTPYREALLQVKHRTEAARRGETPPALPTESTPTLAVATPGEVAPDFVSNDLTGSGSARLRSWQGRPVLLVFYNPTSPSAVPVLRFAQHLLDSFPHRLAVLGMAVTEDTAAVRRQHTELRLAYPVLSGTSLSASYGLHDMPKLVLLDASQIVRGEYVGWGSGTAAEVLDDLKRWLVAPIPLPPSPQR
jgi:peroxiredoxin